MSAVSEPKHDWTELNQRLLVAELAALKALLAGEDDAIARERLEECRAAMPAPAAIDHLARIFGLSEFERALLLLVAGVEMDAEIGPLCAGSAGSPHKPGASFGLGLSLLPDPHWSALTPTRPLRHCRLIEVADDGALVGARLHIDERVLHYLAGVNYLDPRLQPLLRCVGEAELMGEVHRLAADAIYQALAGANAPVPLIELAGDDPHGKQDVAASVAARCGLQLHAIACESIPSAAHEQEALVALWEREAALIDSALLIECDEGASSIPAHRFAERVHGLIALAVREPVALSRGVLRQRIDKPCRHDRHRLWHEALGPGAARLAPALERVASEVRLSARDIARTGAEVDRAAAPSDAEDLLYATCRGLERARLEGLAQRIEPVARWDDLVLPEPQKDVLRQIAMQVRQRPRVHDQWGFGKQGARGFGASLFVGESGTGKSLAGEVLASELRIFDLWRIDLSAVVSKYIGETEKNLARVFEAAEDSGAILLFDEADALFGKRSEVKDSHDRYANIEVSYLLQRMEAYRGLAILTSNQKTALDPAFHRRLRFIVHFPFPDAAQREAIWRGIFPSATPTRGLDFAKLARLNVAGGHIRNIALNAAFFAAEEDEPVGMGHVLRAAHAEAGKRERTLTDAETRGWV